MKPTRPTPQPVRRAHAPVSLRDAIVAVADLDAFDPADAAAVRAMLGWAERTASLPAPPATGRLDAFAPPPPRPPSAGPLVRPPPAAPPPQPEAALRPSTLQPLPRLALARPAWLPDAAVPPLQSAQRALGPGQPPPIFAPLTARGIFSALLATWVEEGELDAARMAAAVAELRPLRQLPRALVRTLRRGVRLLLDTGAAMEPFEADIAALEASLGALMGAGQIECLYFSGCPSRGVRAVRHGARRRWTTPPLGMPVLVVSDFGISGSPFDEQRADTSEWLRFAQDVHANDHRLVGLTPFERTRWPAELSGAIHFVAWSERTAAGGIDRRMRLTQRGAR